MNGPLKVYLDIKEGKTSAKKIIEEYEDERNLLHERLGVRKPDLLPTETASMRREGIKKRNVPNKQTEEVFD